MRLSPQVIATEIWRLVSDSVLAFIADEALTRGAAIAYYSIFSIAPVLVLVIAIAGLAFGETAARGAITQQLGDLMGQPAAELLQNAIKSVSDKSAGVLATVTGIVILLIVASGVFGEMQSALNVIWKASPQRTVLSQLVRARLISLGLVAALGFLLLVSLVVSAALAVISTYFTAWLPFGGKLLMALNFILSFVMIAVLFAAIYKVLPDQPLEWRDVVVGAIVTTLLFTIGKFLIGLYIGHSAVTSIYGAAGGVLVVLLWIYYSAQIFLFGAEFTKVYATRHGSHRPDARKGNTAQ